MDIDAYISSGILELYATNSLDTKERLEVEALLFRYPELRTELNEIDEALEQYAVLHSVEPKSALKNNIMAAIDAPKVYKLNTTYRLGIAASVAFLLGMGAIILSLLSQVKEKDGIIAQLSAEKEQYQLIRTPNTTKIVLTGVEKYPESDAVLYWDAENKQVIIDCVDLPSAEEGYQYQLWALFNGKPIDAGVFEHTLALQQLKTVSQAQAFAVTLEPKGGSENPTLDKMYLYTEL